MGAYFWILSLLIAICSFWWMAVGKKAKLPTQLLSIRSCLLVTAHPDDECMFFSPTLLALAKAGVTINILCLSTGNADGLGSIRRVELLKSARALGVPEDHVAILDSPELQDGPKLWSSMAIEKVVLEELKKLSINMILTFDDYGVSGHPNHISIYHAVRELFRSGKLKASTVAYSLTSVPLLRKFTFFLDIPVSYLVDALHKQKANQEILLVSSMSDYLASKQAMFAHSSQLVWFRYLYISFSRYMIINTLKKIR